MPSSERTRGVQRFIFPILSCGSSGGHPCTQAGVEVRFALISRAHAKITTRTAWVHGGALRAPPCTEAVVVVFFAWAREISANFTTTPTWVHRCPPLLPQETITVALVSTLLTYCGQASLKNSVWGDTGGPARVADVDELLRSRLRETSSTCKQNCAPLRC